MSSISSLEGLYYDHPHKGRREITIDRRLLAGMGKVYVGRKDVREALRIQGATTVPLEAALALLSKTLKPGWVLGFSGFATAGFDYTLEKRAMVQLYQYLASQYKKPSLSIDGGVGAGVLGLNGELAKQYKVPSLGCLPFGGLPEAGQRTHTVVWGNSFEERERIVGNAGRSFGMCRRR